MPLNKYTSVICLNEGIYGVEATQYGRRIWVSALCRKAGRLCELCKKDIAVKDKMIRPITNGYNRGERMHLDCAKSFKEK